jgi:hypothetical protein
MREQVNERGWEQELAAMNRLTKLMQDHETQLVQGQVDLKYLESSAAVFAQYQELCRRAAEKEAELASRLVAIQV